MGLPITGGGGGGGRSHMVTNPAPTVATTLFLNSLQSSIGLDSFKCHVISNLLYRSWSGELIAASRNIQYITQCAIFSQVLLSLRLQLQVLFQSELSLLLHHYSFGIYIVVTVGK